MLALGMIMNDHIDFHSFSGADALARHAARRWLDPAAPPFPNVALSGGRIARGFLGAAASLAAADTVAARKLTQTRFFWADERCVPPEDAESNFRIAREALFDPLALSAAGIHRIQGELDPSAAVLAASEMLGRILPSEKGLPVLDLVFLGMGEDGHVASLFDVVPDKSGGAPYQVVVGPKPPNPRITLTFPVLAAAREVWVLVSGAGKEMILRKSLQGKSLTPLARLIQLRESTVLLVDDSFFEHRAE